MSKATEWLDSIESLAKEKIMPETNDRELFRVLGGITADVKHVALNQERSRADSAQMRMDMKQDTAEVRNDLKVAIDSIKKDHDALDSRIAAIESWQTKMMAYMAILIPVAIAVGQFLAPVVLALI